MGRGKDDTCSNCKNKDYDRKTDTYTCTLDGNEVEKNDWCKHHENED